MDPSVCRILPLSQQAVKVLPTPALTQESGHSHSHPPMSTSTHFDASSVSIPLVTHISPDIYTTTPPFIRPALRPEINLLCTQASTFPSTHWVLTLDQLFQLFPHISFSLITARLPPAPRPPSRPLLTYDGSTLLHTAPHTSLPACWYHVPSPPSQHALPVAHPGVSPSVFLPYLPIWFKVC